MRPLKLTMSAFISYSGITVIDFDKLGKSGIYLITGETGAGKTTIFDAITFALYGKANNKDRKPEMLRSKYADEKTKTKVILEFECSGKKYIIERSPTVKTEGNKNPTQGKATLTYPDGKTVSGIKEVTEAVEDIIHMDSEKFSQISMLAQGNFKKFLSASSKDRQEIFRDIFSTSLYENLQSRLSAIYRKAENELKTAEKSVKQSIESVKPVEDTALTERFKNSLGSEEAADIIKEIIGYDTSAENALNKEQEKLSMDKEETAKLLAIAEEYEAAVTDMEIKREQLNSENENNLLLKKKLEAEKSRQSEYDRLMSFIGKTEAELIKYDALKEKQNEENKANKELSDNGIIFQQTSESLPALKENYEKLIKENEGLKDAGMQREKLIAEKDRLTADKRALEKLIIAIRGYNQTALGYSIKIDEFNEAEKEWEHKSAIYADGERAFFRSQAGIIAEKLRDDEECPVCGSKVHPHKAHKEENAPSKEELDSIKKEAEAAHARLIKATGASKEIKGKLSEAEKNMLEQAKAFTDKTTAKEIEAAAILRSDETETERKLLDKRITAEENNIRRKNELDKMIPEADENINAAKQQLNELEKAKKVTENRIEDIRQQIISLIAELSYENKEQAENAIREKKAAAKKIKDDLDAAQKNLSDSENRINLLMGAIGKLKEIIAKKPDKNAAALREKNNSLDTDIRIINEKIKIIHARRMYNESILSEIRKNMGETARLEKECAAVKELSDTANGEVKGSDKIRLEAYFQTAYFDRILYRANLRLRGMTGGQYELCRSGSNSDGRSTSGLDIDVIDHYNGTKREAATISGGESFKASLALALGLSDEIQNTSGAVRLETLFIDEGFGSLDDTSLEQAIKTLMELGNENRLVGIISHVNELKEKIDKQIIVTKEKNIGNGLGTRAEIRI